MFMAVIKNTSTLDKENESLIWNEELNLINANPLHFQLVPNKNSLFKTEYVNH